MVKFADIPYVRPDMDAAVTSVKAVIRILKNAKTYEEFRSAYMDYVQIDMELATAQQLVYIRHTINMLDEYMQLKMHFSMRRYRGTESL